MPETLPAEFRDATPDEVAKLVNTALHSRSPLRRSVAQAALLQQELPVGPDAVLIAARRQIANEEMAWDACGDDQ